MEIAAERRQDHFAHEDQSITDDIDGKEENPREPERAVKAVPRRGPKVD
jgi:hypothetical protein